MWGLTARRRWGGPLWGLWRRRETLAGLGTSLKRGKDHICKERGRHSSERVTPYLLGGWGALLWAMKTPSAFPISWGRGDYTHIPDGESAQLLVRPLWKTVWSFLRKLKIELPCSQQAYSWAYTQKNSNSKRYMHPYVQSSSVHNSQDVETN